MRPTVFINALREEDKGGAILARSIAVHAGDGAAACCVSDPQVFSEIPTSPFSYQVSKAMRSTFVRFGPLETPERHVCKGLGTGDDFRFVRLWWEVLPSTVVSGSRDTVPETFHGQTGAGRPWVPFAKGGTYAPYYADLHLLVNWRGDGVDIGSWEGAVIRHPDLYFHPGITFPRRPDRRGSFWVLPSGTIFSDLGPGIFSSNRWVDLAWLNSLPAFSLMLMTQPRGTDGGQTLVYEVGYVGRLPYPDIDAGERSRIDALARECFSGKRSQDTKREVSHSFITVLPPVRDSETPDMLYLARMQASSAGLADEQLQENAHTIDEFFTAKLGLTASDLTRSISDQAGTELSPDANAEVVVDDQIPLDEADNEENPIPQEDLGLGTVARTLLSYALGCAFGCWDIRYATGEKTPPELPDPFAPLPVCSPGMLQGEDGLPLTAAPTGYPLHINWNGILVDDGSHPDDDIVQRVRKSLHVLWPATSDSIETEMCDALGVKDLRDYFRKPGSGGFWMDHVHMYSKSHRKAPIYWFLQSSHKSYGIWLYYQRLDSDLLFKVLQNYVEPKLKLEQNHEAEASHQLTAGGLSVSETRQAQKDLEKQQDLVAEIREFRDTLKKAADLRLTPELDDGVVLNIAPLHDLVPWAEASKYWDELLAGKYPWSSIGKQLEKTR